MDGDFRVGRWLVQPTLNTISCNGSAVRLEPKVMEVLVCLASHAGKVASKETILKAVWVDTFVSDDVLTRAISELRRAFEDDPRDPTFIETISKRGYRLVADVVREPPVGSLPHAANQGEAKRRSADPRQNRLMAMVLGLTATIAVISVPSAISGKLWQRLFGKPDFRPIRSIAVLPLKDLSGDPNQEYFAEGMTAELITSLSQISAFNVIGRNSSQVYKDTPKPVSEIAQELGVDAVVKGTVVRFDGRVRFAAELIQAAPERQLWAGNFESGLQDVVTQQRIMAHKIALAVAAQLSPAESQRLTRTTSVNPQAYNDYLLGDYYLCNRLSPEGRREAARYLERAVAEDPNYAPSHASLAEAYFRLAPEVNNSRPNELFERSRAAAFRAVELDEFLPEAHQILGVIYIVSWDLASAGKEFDRALELQPGGAKNLYFHAIFIAIKGRHSDAISEAGRAAALDPLNVGVRRALGKIYGYAGRYDDAIAEYGRALQMDPGDTEIHGDLGQAYEAKGDYPRAIAELQKSRSDVLQAAQAVALLGYIFARQGQTAKASACLQDLHRMSRSSSYDVTPLDFAIVYAGMGNADMSLAWLKRAYHQHSQFFLEITSQPEYATLRPDPRFQELVRGLGLE